MSEPALLVLRAVPEPGVQGRAVLLLGPGGAVAGLLERALVRRPGFRDATRVLPPAPDELGEKSGPGRLVPPG